MIAGGGWISMGGNHEDRVALRSLTVVAGTNGRQWRARAGEVTPTGRSWVLWGEAICANVTTHSGAADYANPVYVRTDTTALDSRTTKGTQATCKSGDVPIGGGAEVIPASTTSASNGRRIRLTASEPDPITIVPVASKGWYASASSSSSVARWRLRAWVVCAGLAGGP